MIHTERLLREFETLVSFDCESFHEGTIKEYLKAKLLSLGLTVSEDNAAEALSSGADGAGNLFARLKGKEEGPPLLFSSHMDTVAPGKGKKAGKTVSSNVCLRADNFLPCLRPNVLISCFSI